MYTNINHSSKNKAPPYFTSNTNHAKTNVFVRSMFSTYMFIVFYNTVRLLDVHFSFFNSRKPFDIRHKIHSICCWCYCNNEIVEPFHLNNACFLYLNWFWITARFLFYFCSTVYWVVSRKSVCFYYTCLKVNTWFQLSQQKLTNKNVVKKEIGKKALYFWKKII